MILFPRFILEKKRIDCSKWNNYKIVEYDNN